MVVRLLFNLAIICYWGDKVPEENEAKSPKSKKQKEKVVLKQKKVKSEVSRGTSLSRRFR